MEAVRVIYHQEGDGWWAESPDVEGWSAAGDSLPKVKDLADESLALALGHRVRATHLIAGADAKRENAPARSSARRTRRSG